MFIGLRFSFGQTSITEINVDQQSNLATKTTTKFIHSILLAFKCSYIHYGRMISMFFLTFFSSFVVIITTGVVVPAPFKLYHILYGYLLMIQRTFELSITGQAFLFWGEAEQNVENIEIFFQI